MYIITQVQAKCNSFGKSFFDTPIHSREWEGQLGTPTPTQKVNAVAPEARDFDIDKFYALQYNEKAA